MSLKVALYAHPTLERNHVRTGMIGTNDVSVYGGNSNQDDTSLKAQEFAAAQSTIPDSLKAFGTTCTATGTWTPDPSFPGAVYTTANGATLSCTFNSSSAYAYMAYMRCDNTSSGAGTLSVNGAPGSLESAIAFYSPTNASILTPNGAHCAMVLARNAGVAGANTATYTSVNTGRQEVFWMGGPYVAPATAMGPPVYLIGGVIYEQGDAQSSLTALYNTLSNTAYTTMLGDGNNVRWANVRAYMNYTTDFTGGGGSGPDGNPWAASWILPLHPGDSGHAHIYQAFHDLMPVPPKQSQALALWNSPSGAISAAGSTAGRDGLSVTGAKTALAITNSFVPDLTPGGVGGGPMLGIGTATPDSLLSNSNISGSVLHIYYGGAPATGGSRLMLGTSSGNYLEQFWYYNGIPTGGGNRIWRRQLGPDGDWKFGMCTDSLSPCVNFLTIGHLTGSYNFGYNAGINAATPNTWGTVTNASGYNFQIAAPGDASRIILSGKYPELHFYDSTMLSDFREHVSSGLFAIDNFTNSKTAMQWDGTANAPSLPLGVSTASILMTDTATGAVKRIVLTSGVLTVVAP